MSPHLSICKECGVNYESRNARIDDVARRTTFEWGQTERDDAICKKNWQEEGIFGLGQIKGGGGVGIMHEACELLRSLFTLQNVQATVHTTTS